jgi:hypothetical protein
VSDAVPVKKPIMDNIGRFAYVFDGNHVPAPYRDYMHEM